MHLLRLMRRSMALTLKAARVCFEAGLRAQGLRELKTYRTCKADLERVQHEVFMRLGALIRN